MRRSSYVRFAQIDEAIVAPAARRSPWYRVRREFRDRACLVVDDHHQIKVADRRRRPIPFLDIGLPLDIVAALASFLGWLDAKRRLPIFSNDIALADELSISLPS
jgi:hypothetical protein